MQSNQITIYPQTVSTTIPTTPQQLNLNLDELLPSLITFMIVMLMMKIMTKTMKEIGEPTKTPPKRLFEGGPRVGEFYRQPEPTKAVVKERVHEEELKQKKASLIATGKKIAKEAGKGVKFLRLDEGWQQEHATIRFWFKDLKGNNIIATDIDELNWKLSRQS